MSMMKVEYAAECFVTAKVGCSAGDTMNCRFKGKKKILVRIEPVTSEFVTQPASYITDSVLGRPVHLSPRPSSGLHLALDSSSPGLLWPSRCPLSLGIPFLRLRCDVLWGLTYFAQGVADLAPLKLFFVC